MAPAACSWPCLWIHAKLARNCLPKFPKRIPPLHGSTIAVKDGGCGLQLAVPNVTFWIHKKLAPNCLPKLPTRTPLLHWNTMAVKDGWRGSWPCLASLSENCLPKRMPPAACSWPCVTSLSESIHTKLGRTACLPKLPKRTPPLHWNTMAVKDGACGLQLAVPNVSFWIHKKLAPNCLPKLPKTCPLLRAIASWLLASCFLPLAGCYSCL